MDACLGHKHGAGIAQRDVSRPEVTHETCIAQHLYHSRCIYQTWSLQTFGIPSKSDIHNSMLMPKKPNASI